VNERSQVYTDKHTNTDTLQVGQLSQPNRAAACISFGENLSAKIVHVTSLYPKEISKC